MRFPTYGAEVDRWIRTSYAYDYTRYSSLALAIKAIQDNRIGGAFAEVGVYRGATSQFLHYLAPERRLYLFDTFEGFPLEHLEPVQQADDRFRDTSVAILREMVGTADSVVIRKGIFPETARGLEDETFALVLLDLDLYAPTRAGLDFFYPRLVSGGYLFVHDYNSPESNSGCHRAVTEFMKGKPERLVEIPDVWGTALFRRI